LSPKTLQRSASALRALLRWWHVQGLTASALVEAVPKVAHRDPGLPRGLRPEQVAAMLGLCDRSCPAGLRDFAMLGRTDPDHAWHQLDGRVTELGMHLTVDPVVHHEVVVGITAARA
jgi:hypothetical protein